MKNSVGWSQYQKNIIFGMLIVACAAMVCTFHSVAHATYPGQNGRIVFSTERDGNREIYTMNSDGTNQIRITNNSSFDSEPTWSPDGDYIVFRSDSDGNRELYIMNADGSNQTRLTNDASRDMQPMYSPDGTKIIFTSDRGQSAGQYRLWIMNTDGTGQTLFSSGLVFGAQASWSPNGSKIAYNGNQGSGNEIFVVNADGTNIVQLTSNGSGSAPDWSPSGSQIVFSSADDLYKINANGTGQVRLTFTGSTVRDNHPTWSPDGTKILYDSNPSGGLNYDMHVMNPDGTNITVLDSNLAFDEYPRYFAQALTLTPSPTPSLSPEVSILAPNTGVGPRESNIPAITFAIIGFIILVTSALIWHTLRKIKS